MKLRISAMSRTPEPELPVSASGKRRGKRRLPKWFRSLLTNHFTSPEAKRRNERWFEIFALCFVLTMTILTYLYGTLYIVPVMAKRQLINEFVQAFLYLLATWVGLGVWVNLFLILHRDTSIRKMNLVKAGPLNHVGLHSQEQELMQDAEDWHICSSCELWVPPRAWHCKICKTCILRRDHHCIFATTCIGQNNHINFLGFLAYMSIGCVCTFGMGLAYIYFVLGIGYLEFMGSAIVECATLFTNSGYFDMDKFLFPASIMGAEFVCCVFACYFFRACANQTSADTARGIERTTTSSFFSYENLEEFFGEYPLIRILWPFYPLPECKGTDGSLYAPPAAYKLFKLASLEKVGPPISSKKKFRSQ